MRRIFLSLFIFPLQSFAQDSLLHDVFPVVEGKIAYSKIVEVDSVKKDQLFLKIKDWASKSYVSQKATLDAEDKNGGLIVYKGYLPAKLIYHGGILNGKSYEVDIFHTIRFYIKDFKFKVVLTDLQAESHDAASIYISNRTYKPIEKIPLESLGNAGSKKRKEKSMEDARNLNNQLLSFLESVKEYVSKGKSEFNF